MLIAILFCLGLTLSAANAGASPPDEKAQSRSLLSTIGPPVLREAENATFDSNSLGTGGSSRILTRADSSSTNQKIRRFDQNYKVLENAAAAHDVPLDFFFRLIKQESNFDPNSVSHKGAQGIAQFMPGTARWRGLADPFEPVQALYESARWLRELREQFGNLGLAAAAYNAGPRRVQDWLAGRGGLPEETRAYVRIVTGRSAEEWSRGPVEDRGDPHGNVLCNASASRTSSEPRIVKAVEPRSTNSAEKTGWGPWGLQLTGNWSETKALSDFKLLQKRFSSVLGDRAPMILKSRMAGRGSAPWYLIRVAESTRDRANQLCARLESIGGSCLVYKN